ncbi:hypothetical protein BGZ98_006651, partial [Dissophora globulifera]
MATPSGSLASASRPTPPTLSLSLEAGTRLSRSGSSPSASCAPTTLDTPATSTPSLSPPMVRSAPLVDVTVSPCSGTLTRASTCTLSRARVTISSTRWCSPPTATGCAPRRRHASRSGTWSPSR